jgi:phosphohistidine phosphatase SixA
MKRLLLLLGLLAWPGGAVAEGTVLAPLRDRAVGLMRHGGAVMAPPGTPSPIGDCNAGAVLTEIGREEMRRWGDRLRAEGFSALRVLTSRQCSAWETGALLGFGEVRREAALEISAGPEALRRALLAAAAEREAGGPPTILVTHRATIAALTGIELLQGEMMLLVPSASGLTLLGRVSLD